MVSSEEHLMLFALWFWLTVIHFRKKHTEVPGYYNFDNKLQWRAQVNNVCKKISYYLYMLSSHQKSLTFDVLKMLNDSLILFRIDYALPVWGLSLFLIDDFKFNIFHNDVEETTV